MDTTHWTADEQAAAIDLQHVATGALRLPPDPAGPLVLTDATAGVRAIAALRAAGYDIRQVRPSTLVAVETPPGGGGGFQIERISVGQGYARPDAGSERDAPGVTSYLWEGTLSFEALTGKASVLQRGTPESTAAAPPPVSADAAPIVEPRRPHPAWECTVLSTRYRFTLGVVTLYVAAFADGVHWSVTASAIGSDVSGSEHYGKAANIADAKRAAEDAAYQLLTKALSALHDPGGQDQHADDPLTVRDLILSAAGAPADLPVRMAGFNIGVAEPHYQDDSTIATRAAPHDAGDPEEPAFYVWSSIV